MELKDKLLKIKAMAFDIDGVFTDGCIIPIGPTHDDLVRVVDAKDSFAVRVAAQKGYETAIISGGDTPALRYRFKHMKFKEENLFMGARGKLKIFVDFCKQYGFDFSEVAYFGDDIPDTQVLKLCGLAVVPSDACEEAIAVADYVCRKPGGHGAVREGVELIMKAQGTWKFDEERYDLLY